MNHFNAFFFIPLHFFSTSPMNKESVGEGRQLHPLFTMKYCIVIKKTAMIFLSHYGLFFNHCNV